MLTITISTKDVERQLSAIQAQQLPFATALALTRTAQNGQKAMVESFSKQFDRPTPYTLRSTFIVPATKTKLESSFGVKDLSPSGTRFSPADILAPHFYGGTRALKASEFRLRQAGFLDADEYIVPGAGARLDAYGNVSRGQIVQMLSQLKLEISGSASAATRSPRSRRKQAQAGRIFWSRGPDRPFTRIDRHGDYHTRYSHLAKGAWIVSQGQLAPLFIATHAPHYKKRFDMDRIKADTIRTFNAEFERAMAVAIATAR